MKASELREMTTEELERKVKDVEEELFRLRFAAGRGGEVNAASKQKSRRDLARAITILRERALKGKSA